MPATLRDCTFRRIVIVSGVCVLGKRPACNHFFSAYRRFLCIARPKSRPTRLVHRHRQRHRQRRVPRDPLMLVEAAALAA